MKIEIKISNAKHVGLWNMKINNQSEKCVVEDENLKLGDLLKIIKNELTQFTKKEKVK